MKYLFVFFFLILSFIFTPLIFADQNFSVSLDQTYTVSENGSTHITIQGEIKNKSNKYFPSMFSFLAGFTDIKNLTATDSLGRIKTNEEKNSNVTKIVLTFNNRPDGVGSKEDFLVTFDTLQVARKNGLIWEISIPGIANQADFESFNIHVIVPKSFGNPSYIKPTQIGNSLDFDKNTIGTSGISLAYGKIQSYNFSLSYHLKNTSILPVTTQIALPPDTNYQTVILDSLSPKPLNVLKDIDGNWIARYSLSASQEIDVLAKGTVLVVLNPKEELLSEKQKNLYLRQQPFWQTQNASIKKIATDLKTPRAIYDYVVNRLKYDYSRIAGSQTRLGAQKVLENPTSAVCLEFSDLFVTLARAAGIPSREIDGFAYTTNSTLKPVSLIKDILHTWPEYYDFQRKMWIMVDPTWQNTTRGIDYFSVFDFDHITFSINGESSTNPLPAGSYKISEDSKKDVSITFGDVTASENPQISVLMDFPSKIVSGLPLTGFLDIKNIGKTLVPAQKIMVESSTFNPKKNTITSDSIPPFGTQKTPITFNSGSFLTKEKETITIQVARNTLLKWVSVVPFFVGRQYFYEGVAFAIFSIIILIIAAKTRSLPFFRKRG